MRPHRTPFALAFIILLLASVHPSTLAQTGGKIAFVSDRDGIANIFVMNADGSQPTNLTHSDQYEDEPVWSPDGQTIAFARNTAGDDQWDLFTVTSDGSAPTQLTDGVSYAQQIGWSPDGSQIVFAPSPDLLPQITIINADGTNMVQVSASGNQWPAWSPDGQHIAFTMSNPQGIALIAPEGSGQQSLTNAAYVDTHPLWSPDGQYIAFASKQNADADWEIFVINADGSNLTQLTDNDVYDGEVTWSPDSQQIAFTSERDGDSELYVMGRDGSNVVRLTQSAGRDSGARWSPDGQQIAFITERDGNFEIYVMNTDGLNPVNLTNNPATDYGPAWQPIAQSGAIIVQPAQVSSEATAAPTEALTQAAFVPQNLPPITADNADELTVVATIGSADHPIAYDSIAFSPTGQYLAYRNSRFGDDYAIDLYDLAAGHDSGLVIPGPGFPQWLAFSADGSTVIALSQTTPELNRWSLPSGDTLPFIGFRGASSGTNLSPDGSLMVGLDGIGGVLVNDTATGEPKYTVEVGNNFGNPVLSPDNRLLAVSDPNGPVTLWDVTTGTMLFSLPSNGGYDLAFSPDSQTVALCGANNGIELWNTATGQELQGLPDAGCTRMAFSPDGSLLATSNFLDASIYDLTCHTSVARYPGRGFAFSADGHYFAAVTNDGILTIYAAPGDAVPVEEAAPTVTAAPAEASDSSSEVSGAVCSVTANGNANLRGGPGTTFNRVGSIAGGQTVDADGQSQPGNGFTWYRLSSGGWIRGDLVSAAAECSGLPTVSE